jgi:heat shock protein HslJ
MRLTKPKLGRGLSFLAVAIAFTSITTVVAQTNRSALIGTNWKLIELDGKSVLHSGFESHFALKANERGVGWSTGQLENASEDGCNDLSGFYVTNGDSLRINPSHTTLLLCGPNRPPAQQEGNAPTPERPGPASFYKDSQPTLFIVALKKTSGYRIHGSILELLDPNGTVLARMVATRADDL